MTIADVIKLVRLGALVLVLLPMMNPDLANAYEVTALNDHDERVVSKLIFPSPFWQMDQIESSLESVEKPNGAKINGVSVTEMLSLRIITWDCSIDELLRRRRIAFALLNERDLESMHIFARHLFRSYVDFCFYNVKTIAALFDGEMRRTQSSRNTIESFLEKVALQNKNLQDIIGEIATNDDVYDLLEKSIGEYLRKDSNSADRESLRTSCKEVFITEAVLRTLFTCSNSETVQDQIKEFLYQHRTRLICSALSAELLEGLSPPSCLCLD